MDGRFCDSHFDKSSKLFIQDMLSSKNDVLDEKSTAALWQYLAFCIQDDNGRGTSTGKFKNQFDNVIPNGLAYNTGSTGIYSANKSSGDNKYNVYSSGLVHGNSDVLLVSEFRRRQKRQIWRCQ